MFVCGLGLTGFVQFIDITLSNYLIASAYLTCKQYYNAAEKRKSNNSVYFEKLPFFLLLLGLLGPA